MKTSKKKQTKETEKQVISIPEDPFADVKMVQTAINVLSNFKDTKDPRIIKIRRDFYKAREESIFDGIVNAHFGRYSEGDNAEGRFMI